jgi:murein DD-endopeptidase MepM/ murein hydrolase activator NlpD
MASERITKKPFGKYVNPNNSPVSPERFTGYHVAVDFETFQDEQDKDIEVYSICDGRLVVKRSVSGYGGVIIQDCKINNQAVTVLYGHLRLSSVAVEVGQTLKSGDLLGVLGTGYTIETDNERKHLHLSIHKGTDPVLTGYIQDPNLLSSWLDPKIVLGL